jgi:hypothetical protein
MLFMLVNQFESEREQLGAAQAAADQCSVSEHVQRP